MTANGLYFAVRIEDAVTTFEGLPIALGSAARQGLGFRVWVFFQERV